MKNINVVTSKNQALIAAIVDKDKIKIELLLKEGADVNFADKDNNNTPLREGIRSTNVEIVKLLIENGANVNLLDKIGQTPIFEAIHCATVDSTKIDVIDLLIKSNSNVNIASEFDQTPLLAAIYTDEHVIKLLIENGADVNIMNKFGEIPIFKAIRFRMISVVKSLIENGTDVDITDQYGSTPIFKAIHYENTYIIKLLLRNGADVNFLDMHGSTPIFYTQHNMYIFKLLLRNGADINIINKFGETPLNKGVRYTNVKIIKLLLKNAADIHLSTIKIDKESKNCEQVMQLLENAKKIDEYLEKGEFDNEINYDQSLFAGRYALYLAKNEVKKDSEESKKIFDKILADLQSAAFNLTPLTLTNLIEQKYSGLFDNSGNENTINELTIPYDGYNFKDDVTKFLNGEITLTDIQIDNFKKQIFKINLDIVKANLTDLLNRGYAAMLEPLLKLSLPQNFKISLVKAFIKYNIGNNQENILDINCPDQDNIVEIAGEYQGDADLS